MNGSENKKELVESKCFRIAHVQELYENVAFRIGNSQTEKVCSKLHMQ